METFVFLSIAILNSVLIGVGSLLVMPGERRRAWRSRIRAALLRLVRTADSRIAHGPQKVAAASAAFEYTMRRAWKHVVLRRSSASVIATVLLLPPLLVVVFTHSIRLDGYEDVPTVVDPVVAALLQGEQLVAPPPLPPELFITREVEAQRQELAGASREWQALDAEFRRRLLTVYQLMARRGYRMALLEGYRSPERQAVLAHLGPHVTNAGAFQSFHQYGLAADSAFYRDGKLIISEKDPWAMEGYRLYGEYAESVGLVWGGRWRMMDFGHVELRKSGMLRGR